MYRILFLGTAGDSIVMAKQYRSCGGVVLQLENNMFHIDPGPGSLDMAKRMNINLRENNAIFISKNNVLRANDVNAIISAMTHDGLDKKGVVVAPSSVITNEDKLLSNKYNKFLEKVIVVDNTNRIAINNSEIAIVHTKEPNCKGFKFNTQKFTLGYVPDTAYFPEFGEKYKDCDILIINVKNSGTVKESGHLNIEDAEFLLKKADPQLVILTGFGIKMLQSDPMYEVRELQKHVKCEIVAAKDGMTINPVSFTTTVRQKKLS